MAQRIIDVLEVLNEIYKARRAGQYRPVEELRKTACKVVAERRGVTEETIRDACTRRMKPHIKGMAEFDQLVRDWLGGGHDLRKVLESRALHHGDNILISHFFDGHSGR